MNNFDVLLLTTENGDLTPEEELQFMGLLGDPYEPTTPQREVCPECGCRSCRWPCPK